MTFKKPEAMPYYKLIYTRLLDKNKKPVIEAIAEKFNMNKDGVRDRWIAGNKVPLDKQETVIAIIRDFVDKQQARTGEVLAMDIELVDHKEL